MYGIRMFVVLACAMILQSCSQVDDYILGKDNTPHPKPLADIVQKVDIKTLWSVSIGSSSKKHTYLKLKPVVQKGVIYTADASGMVHAVNAQDGHILWSNKITHPIVSGPTVADGSVVVGTDSSTVVLLNQKDGHTVWEAHLSEDSLSKSLITKHQVISKTIDGNLYAFDISTGKKLWVAEHGSPSLILKASSSPVSMGDAILVGFSDGKLDAIDAVSGREIWQRSIAYATGASDVERLVDIDADPIVRDKAIYLASYQGYIGALSLESGQFIWNKPGSVYKNMAMDRDTLYVTDSKDILWAFDLDKGIVKWKQTALNAHGLTEPVLLGNRLIVGDKTGILHVVSTRNGELLGRKQMNFAIDVSPDVSGGVVYVTLANGNLSAMRIN